MRVIVFGARGDVGSRIVSEALSRGHIVTGVVRNAEQASTLPDGVRPLVVDVQNADDVASAIEGHDFAVSAIRPPDGAESKLAPLTRSILDGAARAGIRVLIVGGAASLAVPGTDGHTVLSAPGFLPDAVVRIAQASQAQFDLCLAELDADWTYLSPPAMLVPGSRTGQFRIGDDELLVDAEGRSQISMEDLAVAMIDEGEKPYRHRARFTVAY